MSIIILTYQEQENIGQALESVDGWAKDVFIVDSYSSDMTIETAQRFTCRVYENRFSGYSDQRNWALENLPIETEWVLFLDADEWLTDRLKDEITEMIAHKPKENGFYIKRRFYWMGRWIKHGYYPVWILRLFRAGKARCEQRPINEHILVDGAIGYLRHDFIHEDRRGIGHWIDKHNTYARMEALELLRRQDWEGYVSAKLFGDPVQRKRWMKQRVYDRLPPLLRPLLRFLYRYFLRLGVLDGRAALIYHFLHSAWFPLLTYLHYAELRGQNSD